jgi:hypothetical protein
VQHRVHRILTAGAAIAALTSACVPMYRPPRSDEPHAILKVRRSYEKQAGTNLRELVGVNEHRAYSSETHSTAAVAPRTDAILIHPEPAHTEVGSTYYHTEQRTVLEHYTEYETEYYNESYDCSTGYGTSRSYRTCNRMATRQRSVPKTRWVHKQVEVTDGNCSRFASFMPKVGGVYLLQYTYQDNGVCTLACFEQRPVPDGTFSNAPCPPAPARAD